MLRVNDVHVNEITTKTNRNLNFLPHDFRTCSAKSKGRAYKALLVRSSVKYSATVWDNRSKWFNDEKFAEYSGATTDKSVLLIYVIFSQMEISGTQAVWRTSLYAVQIEWLKTFYSTFQDVDFDGSYLPLFINWCYDHGIKKLPNHC